MTEPFDSTDPVTLAFQNCWLHDERVRADLLNAAYEELCQDYDVSDFDLGNVVIERAKQIADQHESLRLFFVQTHDQGRGIDQAVVGDEVRHRLIERGML